MSDPLLHTERVVPVPESIPTQPEVSPVDSEPSADPETSAEIQNTENSANESISRVADERPASAPVTMRVTVPLKDPALVKLEAVLEEDLTDLFLAMPPDDQAKFKKTGEETALQIQKLLEQAKVNFHKIFKLIKTWLKLIPGVNRFFLEQEAKIKTDKIRLLTDADRHGGGHT